MRKRRTDTRDSGAVDRYLHAFLLLADHGQSVDTGALAAKVGVSDAAASRMLRTLAEKGFVRVEPYQGAEMTTEGLHKALRIVRRHRLLEAYLHRLLGFDLRQAHERAKLMQPVVDEVFEDKIDELLGHPKFDPHGQPIPSRNATWPKVADSQLLDLPAGTTGRISRVTSEDADAIAYLEGLGIVPGAQVRFQSVSPFDGPVTLSIEGKLAHLGRRLAACIHVMEDAGEERPRTLRARPAIGSGRRPTGRG